MLVDELHALEFVAASARDLATRDGRGLGGDVERLLTERGAMAAAAARSATAQEWRAHLAQAVLLTRQEALLEYEAVLAARQAEIGLTPAAAPASARAHARARSPRRGGRGGAAAAAIPPPPTPPRSRSPPVVVPSKYLAGKQGQLELIKDLKYLRAAVEEATATRGAAAKPGRARARVGDASATPSRVVLKRGESSTDYRV